MRCYGLKLLYIHTNMIVMILAMSAAVASCKDSSSSSVPQRSEQKMLHNDIAATVGSCDISVQQVRMVYNATGLAPRDAVNGLVYDALMAAAARNAGYTSSAEYRVQRRAILARRITDELKKQSDMMFISDEQVNKFTELHWMQLDRPVARQVIHAVVMVHDFSNADVVRKAQAVARDIAIATAGAENAESFEIAAKSVDSQGMKRLVQMLDPVTEDGRVVDPELASSSYSSVVQKPDRYDAQFVKHVFSVAAPGQITGPFDTRFGVHVLMYVKQLDAVRVSFEQRKQLLTPEIRAHYGRVNYEAVVAKLTQQTTPLVQRNADAMLELLYEQLSIQGQ